MSIGPGSSTRAGATPPSTPESTRVPAPASFSRTEHAVARPVDGTKGVCEACGAPGPTHYVEFQQNVGLVVLRLHRAVKGRLCSRCVRQQFGSMTTVTVIAGWWGVISFFLTPIILIGNVVQYLGARKAFRSDSPGQQPVAPGIAAAAIAAPLTPGPAALRGAAPSATAESPRKGLAVASLALGVAGMLCAGLGGILPLVAIVLGFVALGRVARSPEQYGGRGLALGGIATGGVGLVFALVFWGLAILGATGAAKRTPAQAAFAEASRTIDAYADADAHAFGNTEEARAMAERFSRVLKAVDRLAFSGQRETGPSLTQGQFLTYVELRQDSVCFLVHVPQLRAYDGEVRRSLLDLAWTTARETSRDVRKDRDLRLGVGLRGAVTYGAVAVGMGDAKPTQELGSVVSTAPLEAFFAGPDWKAPARLTAATMPASR